MINKIVKSYLKKNITQLPFVNLYKNKIELNKTYIRMNNLFLKDELPIRLAHRIYDLINLPYGLPFSPFILKVVNLYTDSLKRIHNHKFESNEKFSKLLMDIKDKHSGLELDIYYGIKDINKKLPINLIDHNIINNSLDNFFYSRIGIRTLILHNHNITNMNYGLLQNFKIKHILLDAISHANLMSEKNFFETPNFNIECDENIMLLCNPSNIHFILLEVLKNSIISHHKINKIEENININVYDSSDEIVVKIEDFGNSFSYQDIDKIFSYSYTTNKMEEFDDKFIIGGFGFGLPLVNVYMNYINGLIKINPIKNYGTQVFLYFPKKIDFYEKKI